MLTLSATLKTAQQQLDVSPRVSALVGDVPPESVRLSELTTVYAGNEGDVSFDACQSPSTGAVARIRCDGGGTVYAQVVADPIAGPWDAWQQISSSAFPDGPVAAGRHPDGFFRAWWLDADGHTIHAVEWEEGVDNAWHAGPSIDSGAGFLVTSIATDASGQDPLPRVFWVTSGGQLFESHRTGGGWTAPLGDGGAYVGTPTISAGYRGTGAPHGDGNTYLLVAHGNPSTLALKQWLSGSNAWGPAPLTLLQAGVNSGYSYAHPCLAETRVDQLRQAITWVETAPGSLGTTAMLTWTPSHVAIPGALPLGGALLPAGVTLTRGLKVFKDFRSPGFWWLLSASYVGKVTADSPDPAVGQRVAFDHSRVVDFHLAQREPNRPAEIQVTVLNLDGALATAGQPGPNLALRPWSQLALSLGYTTEAGDETVWQIPCWIEALAFRDDYATGVPTVTFFCTDAWGILDRLVCRSTVTFVNQTLDTVLSWIWWHVCGDLDLSPPDVIAGLTLAEFAIPAGETLGDAARRLCERAGVVLRFRTQAASLDGIGWDSVGQTVVSRGTGGSVYSYGPGAGQHPIVQAYLAPAVAASSTSVELIGQTSTSLVRNWATIGLLGHELTTRIVDRTLDGQAETDAAAANLARLLATESRGGEITTLANVGIEMGDQIDVTVPSAGVIAQTYTVVGVVTSWDRERGLLQTLYLEGGNE